METNELLRRGEDLAARCERSNMLTHTGFLTPAEQRELSVWAEHRGCAVTFHGGGADCERRCAFFLPDYLSAEELDAEDTIRAVAFEGFFGRPGHRDYLGAALALGIRREWLGDIRILGGKTAMDFIWRQLS